MSPSDSEESRKTLQPTLAKEKYFMLLVDESKIMYLANYLNYVVDVFREKEGLSIIFEEDILEEMKSISEVEPIGPLAMINLNIGSSKLAGDFLESVITNLAKKEIRTFIFSAFNNVYLFVPYEKGKEAVDALTILSKLSRAS